MIIRAASIHDREEIHRVYWSAFPPGERELVARLAVALLSEETQPPTFALVAEQAGAIVGHVAFSPVTLGDDPSAQGYILAPLAVKPGQQKSGIGSQLVAEGLRRLAEAGADIVFVYGDPAYYGRFGFRAEVAEPYHAPHPLQHPFGWQAVTLKKGVRPSAPVRLACVESLGDPALW